MELQEVTEFATNHPLLSGGFVAVLLFWLYTEIKRKAQGFQELTPAQAVQFMNREQVLVVDLSSLADFNKGHIADAIHVPPAQLVEGEANASKLRGQNVLIVDKAGQASTQGAVRAAKLGAAQVAVLKGGMAQWVSDQYPVTRN